MKLIYLIVFLFVCSIPFFYNAYKLLNCDFKSDYKCEIIHGAGVVAPPISFISVWFDDDSMNGGNNEKQ